MCWEEDCMMKGWEEGCQLKYVNEVCKMERFEINIGKWKLERKMEGEAGKVLD